MNSTKIEWQFCTKEQALRLVELGVKPVALFYHMKAKDGPHGEYIQYGWSSGAMAPAYNVAELLEIVGAFDVRKSVEPLALALAGHIIRLLQAGWLEIPPLWRQDPNDPCADGRCKLSYSKDLEEIKPLPEVEPGEENGKEFTAVFNVLYGSTIQMPAYYRGYQEVTGRHVKLIVDAIKEVK